MSIIHPGCRVCPAVEWVSLCVARAEGPAPAGRAMKRLTIDRACAHIAPGATEALEVRLADDMGVEEDDYPPVTVRMRTWLVTVTDSGASVGSTPSTQPREEHLEETNGAGRALFLVGAPRDAPRDAALVLVFDVVADAHRHSLAFQRWGAEASDGPRPAPTQPFERVLPIGVGPVRIARGVPWFESRAKMFRPLPVLPRGETLHIHEPAESTATVASSTWDCGVLLGAHLSAAVAGDGTGDDARAFRDALGIEPVPSPVESSSGDAPATGNPTPRPRPRPRRRVVELGCGLGPAGASLAAALGVAREPGACDVEILLTDRDPIALNLARDTVRRNARLIRRGGSDNAKVSATTFDWDDDPSALFEPEPADRVDVARAGARPGARARPRHVSAVIAADVVYHEDAFASLVGTLVETCARAAAEAPKPKPSSAKKQRRRGETPVALLAYRRRCDPDTERHFFHMLDAAFARSRVDWAWPSDAAECAAAPADEDEDDGSGGDVVRRRSKNDVSPTKPESARLYRLAPRVVEHKPSSKTLAECGYCQMLIAARDKRLEARGRPPGRYTTHRVSL